MQKLVIQVDWSDGIIDSGTYYHTLEYESKEKLEYDLLVLEENSVKNGKYIFYFNGAEFYTNRDTCQVIDLDEFFERNKMT